MSAAAATSSPPPTTTHLPSSEDIPGDGDIARDGTSIIPGDDVVGAGAAAGGRGFLFLTDDLWQQVLPHLEFTELCAVERLNRQLRRLAGADEAWAGLGTFQHVIYFYCSQNAFS
jgi:hypothetical protein